MTTRLDPRMHQDLQLAGLAWGRRGLPPPRQAVAAHFHKPPDQITEQEFREYLLYPEEPTPLLCNFAEGRHQRHPLLLHSHHHAGLAHVQDSLASPGPDPCPMS